MLVVDERGVLAGDGRVIKNMVDELRLSPHGEKVLPSKRQPLPRLALFVHLEAPRERREGGRGRRVVRDHAGSRRE